ncbi:hypothetical protein FZW96_00005 [Bacillus sp. BGMRC 2118]|nr:hypothetical protein FZW96_00005 [Bacillus sp. BGMRC 2118]
MISNISKTLNETAFKDDVFLSLVQIDLDGDMLKLFFDVTYEEDAEVLQKWEVQCVDYREHKLELYYFDNFESYYEHPRLWKYNHNRNELFFKGKPNSINELMGDLYLTHFQFTKGELPLEYFLNINKNGCGDLEWLLNCEEGLFSIAPDHLNQTYKEILNKYGIRTSIIPAGNQNIKKRENYKIIVFGDSYVIAKEYEAIRII